MTRGLDILEIASQPWCWVPELDGVPTRGGVEYIQPLDHAVQTGREAADGVHRHFSYSFVAAAPDVSLDRVPVDIRQLRAVLDEIEKAVFSMICGQHGGRDALRRAGEALSRLILPAWVLDTLFGMAEGSPLVIRPDELAAAIPFELCHHQGAGRFLGEHLAVSRGIASRRRGTGQPCAAPISGDATVLQGGAIVLNPEGDPKLSRRADDVAALYKQLSSGSGRDLAVYSGSAFPEMLALLGAPLFVYTGHIRFDPRTGSSIECSDRHRLMAGEVGARLTGGRQPLVAVLNGCGGDRADLDFAGGTASAASRSSFARSFYEAGVPSVIGARWEVDLDTAWALNRRLIDALTSEPGQPIGEVLRGFRLGQTAGWPCYMLYGDPRRVFHVRPAESRRPVSPAPGGRPTGLPPALPRTAPSVRRPLVIGMLLDTSEPEALVTAGDPRGAFVQAILGEMSNLTARLAPSGGEPVCRLFVEGWPKPLAVNGAIPDARALDRLFAGLPRRRSPPGGFPEALLKLRVRMGREQEDGEDDAPPPILIVLPPAGRLSGASETSELVRVCDLIRSGPDSGPGCGGALELWAVAFGPTVPYELLLTLTGGESRRTGQLLCPGDAGPLAVRVFDEYRAVLTRRAGRGERRVSRAAGPS